MKISACVAAEKKFNFLDLHKQLKATLQFDTFMCA